MKKLMMQLLAAFCVIFSLQVLASQEEEYSFFKYDIKDDKYVNLLYSDIPSVRVDQRSFILLLTKLYNEQVENISPPAVIYYLDYLFQPKQFWIDKYEYLNNQAIGDLQKEYFYHNQVPRLAEILLYKEIKYQHSRADYTGIRIFDNHIYKKFKEKEEKLKGYKYSDDYPYYLGIINNGFYHLEGKGIVADRYLNPVSNKDDLDLLLNYLDEPIKVSEVKWVAHLLSKKLYNLSFWNSKSAEFVYSSYVFNNTYPQTFKSKPLSIMSAQIGKNIDEAYQKNDNLLESIAKSSQMRLAAYNKVIEELTAK